MFRNNNIINTTEDSVATTPAIEIGYMKTSLASVTPLTPRFDEKSRDKFNQRNVTRYVNTYVII